MYDSYPVANYDPLARVHQLLPSGVTNSKTVVQQKRPPAQYQGAAVAKAATVALIDSGFTGNAV